VKVYHEGLRSWTAAIELVLCVYRLSATFPAAEKYGLAAQARRAAVSIPANIAEGAARGSQVDYGRFLRIARGSLAELETLVTISHRLGFVDGVMAQTVRAATGEIARLLNGQIRALQSRPPGSARSS
jgi:four helix bundle protein